MRITVKYKNIARTLAAVSLAIVLAWALVASLAQVAPSKDIVATGSWSSFDANPEARRGLVASCSASGELCQASYRVPAGIKTGYFEVNHWGLTSLTAKLTMAGASKALMVQTATPALDEKQHVFAFLLKACRQGGCHLELTASANNTNAMNIAVWYEPRLPRLPLVLALTLALLWLSAELVPRLLPASPRYLKRWLRPSKSALPSLRGDLIDPLTETFNRQGLQLRAEELIARQPGCAALCVIDIDRFKYINDAYGHAAGDELLVAFSRRMKSAIRSSDCLARWGGEEFVVLCEQASEKAAGKFAAKLCALAASEPFTVSGSPELQITVSIGLAQHDLKEPFNSLFLRADAALFHAKQSGKNRVCIAPSEREA